MKSEPKLFTVNKILVEATKSDGGAFYDVRVLKNGSKMRYLAVVFESLAKEVKDGKPKEEHSGPPEA